MSGPYTGLAGTEVPVLVQLHCHTDESDGDYTPAQVVAYYDGAGYDVLMISDHDMVTAQPDTIAVEIAGNELSPNEQHILSLNSTYTQGTETGAQALVNGAVGLRSRFISSFDNLYINGFKTYYQPIPVGDWT